MTNVYQVKFFQRFFGIFIGTALVFFVAAPFVFADSSGPSFGSTISGNSGAGSISWTIPSGALNLQDTSYATALLPSNNDVTHYLNDTNFGFSIDSGATIAGIKVEVRRKEDRSTDRVSDNSVRIIKGGSIVGNEKAQGGMWGSTETTVSYGGSSDLWGAIWNPSDINAASFGVAFSAKHDNSSNDRTASVNFIRITVYYTLPSTGTIVVKKIMAGGTATFAFTGTPSGSISTNNGIITSAGVVAGTYTSTETLVSGWDLTSVSCDDGDSVGSIASHNAIFHVAAGETVTCTFTNTKHGTVHVTKTTAPGNDLTQFSVSAASSNGGTVTAPANRTTLATNHTEDFDVTPATYSITEIVPSGWDKTADSCQGLVVVAGQTVNCGITNTKKGHLIVQKTTVPGGDQTQFSISASGNGTITGGGAGMVTDATDKNYEITPGTYSVAEIVPAGWDKTGDACQNVLVAAGQTVTCLLTNTKQTKLTVVKTVVNDNGGTKQISDFVLKIDGNQIISGTANTVSAGLHTVSEINLSGYEASVWGTNCNPDGTIILQQGDIKTCTITNNDIPAKLIVNKVVVNDNGGTKVISDFPLFIGGVQVTSGDTNTVNAGTYTVSENNQTGYISTIGGDCGSNGSVTLVLGETKICTITNDDVSPSLTVTKTVTNDNGGTLQVGDFSLFVDLTQVVSGIANWVNAGIHTVSETPVFGYQGTIGGQCANSGSISLVVGDVKTCTIHNNDIQPTLTVEKIVTNDNGGTKTVQDFPLFIDEIGQVTSEVANPVDAGTYSTNETNQPGYAQSFGGDCDEDGSVTLSVGQNKVCQIINNDIPAKLIVNKAVVNDNGGTKVISDFPLFIGGVQVTSGDTNTVNAGTYTVSENNQSDYTGTFSGDCDTSGSVTLQLGETKTCTITNNDKPGEIHGMKFDDKNGNGVKDEEDTPLAGWIIYLDTNNNGEFDDGEASTTTGADGLYAFMNLSTGTYIVREIPQGGWTQISPGSDTHLKHTVAVTYGKSEENLNFGNFKLTTITGFKWDDKNGDGVWQKSCEENNLGCVVEPGKQDIVVALGRQNGDPKQENGHETIPIEIVAMTLTGGDGGFIIHNVAPGHYKLFEEKKNGWSATNPAARTDSFFDITYDLGAIHAGDPDFDLLRVTGDPDFDLLRLSFFDVFLEFSGQTVNQSEATKGLLTTIPGVPLEFGNHKLLVISQEAAVAVTQTSTEQTSTVITWVTDFPGTSRVVYDTISHLVLGSAPNYGYANSTATFDESPKVTNHSVSVGGLTAGTTYFYRVISAASPESVSGEGSVTTSTPPPSAPSGGGDSGGGILIQNTSGGGGGGLSGSSGGSLVVLAMIPPIAVTLPVNIPPTNNIGAENATVEGGVSPTVNQKPSAGTVENGQGTESGTAVSKESNVSQTQQVAVSESVAGQSKSNQQNISLLAAIGSGITLGTDSVVVGLIVLLTLFGGGVFLVRNRWFT